MTVYFLVVYYFSATFGPLLEGRSYHTLADCETAGIQAEKQDNFRMASCNPVEIPPEVLR